MGTEQALGWEQSSGKQEEQPKHHFRITGCQKEKTDVESGVRK